MTDGVTPVIDRGFARTDTVNLTDITENAVSGRNETYGYTPANRLQHAGGAYGTLDTMYDAVGNRIYELADTGSGTTESVTHYEVSSNRITQVLGNNVIVRTFTHDAADSAASASARRRGRMTPTMRWSAGAILRGR